MNTNYKQPPTHFYTNHATTQSTENIPIHDALPNEFGNTIRVYHQNIGGLNQIDQSITTEDLIETLNIYEFDVLGISEINLDTTKLAVQEDIRKATRKAPGLNLTMSSSPIQAHNKYKPGGVLMMTSGRINGRKLTNIIDPLGRWVGTSFLGKKGKRIHILTLYRPCVKARGSSTKGKTTTYAQQEHALKQKYGKYYGRRCHCFKFRFV